MLFYMNSDEVKYSLFTITATKCSYYVLIFHENFVPANGKKLLPELMILFNFYMV